MEDLEVPDPHGRPIKWKAYSVSFSSPDGNYCFRIYAISDEHAQLQVDAIRDTAKVDGQVVYQRKNT